MHQLALRQPWIATSGLRPPRNDEDYSGVFQFVIARSAATKQSILTLKCSREPYFTFFLNPACDFVYPLRS